MKLFLFLFLIGQLDAENVVSYTEGEVLNFVDRMAQNGEISSECVKSLRAIVPFLDSNLTVKQQRKFFHESFASGEAFQFVSRDMDRWFFKSLECQKVAAETAFSSSEYPVSYCFSMNEKVPSQVYGICIPSPCEKDRQKLLKEWQFLASKGRDKLELNYERCAKSRYDQQWYRNPLPLVNFIIDHSLTMLICLATVYDIKRGGKARSTLGEIFMTFSYTGNLKKLIQMPKNPQSTITAMFGLRFLCMIWTLIGHSFYLVQSFLSNVDEFRSDLIGSFWNQAILNFTLGVDVFLTLSGILVGYSWFSKWHKSKQVPGFTSIPYWLRYYRHRIIRLWPAYIYALIMLATRLSYTHWHPVFPPTDPAEQCPKNWYKNAFLLNSIFGSMCAPWTWYVSAEFVFYLLSPLFLISLYRDQFFGIMFIIATIFMSFLANTMTMYTNNFPPIPLTWGSKGNLFNDDFLSYHFSLYIKPWNRIGPYLIGILLGYHLATKIDHIDKKKSIRFVFIGWLFSISSVFWSLFGAYPAIQGWDWPIYHLFYGSTHRTIFSLGVAWLIYACHTGLAGPINRFLSLRIFLPLSSLSYSVYLIHMVAITFTFLMVPFPIIYSGKLPLFAHCAVQLVISYFLGARIAMVLEMPAIAIEKILLARNRSELKSAELIEPEETTKLKTTE